MIDFYKRYPVKFQLILLFADKFTRFMFDTNYWAERYDTNPSWDAGAPTPPLTTFFDTLPDKNISILIPGCGNAYEARYLLEQGFTNITLLDIVPVIVQKLRSEYEEYGNSLRIACEDFFTHQYKYDLIVEQTFFCALHPSQRKDYVSTTHRLLKPGGYLAGLLFTKEFEGMEPPFGGSMPEYIDLFSPLFEIATMRPAENSIKPRLGTECFFKFIALP